MRIGCRRTKLALLNLVIGESMETNDLDIENVEELQAYLLDKGLVAASDSVAISNLPGGVSSRTMLVEKGDGERWVIKQALSALRVHVEWLSSPERSAREAEGARALSSILPEGAVPRVLFEDRARHLFGMAAVPASAANWKALLLAGGVDIEHFRLAGDLLASIHRESADRRDDFADAFSDRSFFESLRLEPYYEYTARMIPEASPFLSALCESTRSERISLVHGDFSPKNMLIEGNRLVLLDHEVIHFGDPAFDIGFVLAHFLSKAHHLPGSRVRLLDGISEFWRRYCAATEWAPSFERRATAHSLGCLLARVAGRSQLEYLSHEEKLRQKRACVKAMTAPIGTVGGLVSRFMQEVG